MGRFPTRSMMIGKLSLPRGESRTVHKNENNKSKEQMEISTSELRDRGRGHFKRVEMPVISMLRFTDEIGE